MAGFARAARDGLQVGRGQGAGVAVIPRDTPAALAAQIRRLAADVFGHSYVAAMRPTLAISVALLAVGAALCLLLPRLRANAPAPAAAATRTPDAADSRN